MNRCDFDEVYSGCWARVYFFVVRTFGLKRADAEDRTAETFVHVWRAWSRFALQSEAELHSYLFTIARRVVIDQHRRAGGPVVMVDASALELLAVSEPGPEQQAITRDEAARVLALFSRLTADQRKVVCLRLLSELSFSTIAHRVGKSEDTVKQLHYRGLGRLRRLHGAAAPSARQRGTEARP